MDYRKRGVKALSTVLKNKKNIDILERAIYNGGSNEENDYNCALYQVVADVQAKKPIKEIYRSIKAGKVGWRHHSFNVMAQRMVEQNDFIENPFEVEEGVHICKKCGSKRVFSYNRQVRSGDEGTSVFCECVACRAKWQESG